MSSFEDLAILDLAYAEMEETRGWKDYIARIAEMRREVVQELVQGTLDKWGNSRDDEKRAVVHTLDRLLLITPTIHREYVNLKRKKEDIEEKSRKKTGIHGVDSIYSKMSV